MTLHLIELALIVELMDSHTGASVPQETMRGLNITRLVLGDPVLVNTPQTICRQPARAYRPCTNRTTSHAGCSLRHIFAGDDEAVALAAAHQLTLRQQYDLCLIDGDHRCARYPTRGSAPPHCAKGCSVRSYDAAVGDFEVLRDRCRSFLFHDIVNVPRVGTDSVIRLWRELVRSQWARPGKFEYTTAECTQQPALSDQALMGLGIVDVTSLPPVAARHRHAAGLPRHADSSIGRHRPAS